ncbi:MAG: hypothetical protein KF855_16170 [Acidobacteria bacterium]|nr:hypothetical protein [Acidobacteriota bacterium]
MKRAELEAKFEFLETSDEAKARGLQRVKRRFPREKVTIENCWEETTIRLNPDVLDYFEHDHKKINAALREAMLKKKLQDELVEDVEFVNRLREKLAA